MSPSCYLLKLSALELPEVFTVVSGRLSVICKLPNQSPVPENRNKLQRWESSPRGGRRQPDGLLELSSFLNFYKHKKKLDKATGL